MANTTKLGRPQGKRLTRALQIRTTSTLDEGLDEVRSVLDEQIPGISASEAARAALKAGIDTILTKAPPRRGRRSEPVES
jgi:hypothetical protein